MDRKRLKKEARSLVAKNRARAVLALLIPMAVYFVIYMIPMGLFALTEQMVFVALAVIVAILFVPIIVGLLSFFRAFKDDQNTSYEVLLRGYKDGRLPRSLGRLIQMIIQIQLWYILIVIPGIVKAHAYAMTPFILGDETFDDSDKSPIKISREMMDGHKLDLFVWILSFIGWFILGALTLHILTILFVAPYFYQSLALFYENVKAEYMQKQA